MSLSSTSSSVPENRHSVRSRLATGRNELNGLCFSLLAVTHRCRFDCSINKEKGQRYSLCFSKTTTLESSALPLYTGMRLIRLLHTRTHCSCTISTSTLGYSSSRLQVKLRSTKRVISPIPSDNVYRNVST